MAHELDAVVCQLGWNRMPSIIDPYGDTVFNGSQMSVLAEELTALERTLTESGVDRS